MKTIAKMKIRRMEHDDIPGVLEIEKVSFPHPWERREFDHLLSGPARGHSLRVISSADGGILAYAIWQREPDAMRLLNLAVRPEYRRRALAASLIERVARHGSPMLADVIETNVPAQLFLKRLGWRCTEIIRRPYDESDRDALRFEAQYDCET